MFQLLSWLIIFEIILCLFMHSRIWLIPLILIYLLYWTWSYGKLVTWVSIFFQNGKLTVHVIITLNQRWAKLMSNQTSTLISLDESNIITISFYQSFAIIITFLSNSIISTLSVSTLIKFDQGTTSSISAYFHVIL